MQQTRASEPRTRTPWMGRAAASLLALSAFSAGAQEKLIDGIAAQVGKKVVLISEVDEVADPVAARMRKASVPAPEIAMMRADVLDRLIEMRMIANVVERLELGASDEDIEAAISDIARETKLTRAQLEQSVVGHGLTLEEYKAKLRSEIERTKVINTMVRQRVRVEPEEVRELYEKEFGDQRQGGEEVHLRHLMVAFGADFFRDRDTACALVEESERRIKGGDANFARVAREVSDANAANGGELGWIHTEDLAPWMATVVQALDTGQLSGVVETLFGCNLLELVERREYTPVTFERAAGVLEARLFRARTEEEYSKWLDTLRDQIYVERKGSFQKASGNGGDS